MTAPPRAPGELAQIEAIIRRHVRCQWSGEPFEGVTFVILGQAEAAAEIAALRAPQGDGAEAMREALDAKQAELSWERLNRLSAEASAEHWQRRYEDLSNGPYG